MAQYEPKTVNSLDETNPLTDAIEATFTAPFAFSSIAVAAVDTEGNPVSASGGAATVEIKTTVNPFYENLNDDAGSQISLDFTAPVTRVASEAPVTAVRVTPDGNLAGTGVAGYQLSVDQYR